MEENAVQLLDVSDPRAPVAVGEARDAVGDAAGGTFTKLENAAGASTFVAANGRTYAVVTSLGDNGAGADPGVQLIDVSEPAALTAAGALTDTADTALRWNVPDDIGIPLGGTPALFGADGDIYAIVAASGENGVQLIRVSNPLNPIAFLTIEMPMAVATFVVGGSVHAVVTEAPQGTPHGVRLLDVSYPGNRLQEVGSAAHRAGGFTRLKNPTGVATFVVGGKPYAIVTSLGQGAYRGGVQLIDVSDPAAPVAVGAATDGAGGFTALGQAWAVSTFVIGQSTYAIVASLDDGVQLIDVSNPAAPVAVGAAKDNGAGTAFDEEGDYFTRLHGAVGAGLGRIVALYDRPSTLYHSHEHIRCLPLFLNRQCDRTPGRRVDVRGRRCHVRHRRVGGGCAAHAAVGGGERDGVHAHPCTPAGPRCEPAVPLPVDGVERETKKPRTSSVISISRSPSHLLVCHVLEGDVFAAPHRPVRARRCCLP
jgi:hypothetical protein